MCKTIVLWVRGTNQSCHSQLPISQFMSIRAVYSPWRKSPPVVQGLLIIDDLRSHSDTPHSVGFLWTSDQPDTET